MTKEEVAELNEEFKHMDTRTPREKLNALAGDAGRLASPVKRVYWILWMLPIRLMSL